MFFGTAYVIPQYPTAIAGYNAFQAGQIAALAGIAAVLIAPFFPLLVARVNFRLVAIASLCMIAWACCQDSAMSGQSDGSIFLITQLVRGLGLVICMSLLNQAAISFVRPEDAADASGLFNAARNLGGSIGLALLASSQNERIEFHRWTIHAALRANDGAIQDWVSGLATGAGGGPNGYETALRLVDGNVIHEATAKAFGDQFTALAMNIVVVMPLVLFLRPLPNGHLSMAMH